MLQRFFNRRIRVLILNGHVGLGIRNGAIEWVLERHPWVNLALIQEARSGSDLAAALGPKWAMWPVEQHGRSRATEAMTYVCWRKDRFEPAGGWNRDITHGEKHPRRLTAIRLVDRKTGRTVVAASVHVAPLGRGFALADPVARGIHVAQMREYVNLFAGQPEDYVLLAGGDFNEQLWKQVPENLSLLSSTGQFGQIGMKPAHRIVPANGPVRLMELFVKATKSVRVKRRTAFEVPVPGMDHEAVIVHVKVRKLRKKR